MARQVLPVWDGDRPTYIRATAVIQALGYELTYENLPGVDEARRGWYERIVEQDGPVATRRGTQIEPVDARSMLEAWCGELGVDDIGVTAVDHAYVYEGADVPHRSAVMLATAMDYREIAEAPSARSNAEVMRIYGDLLDIAIVMARRIRDLGYPARAHTLAREDIVFIPHAIAAGLGELGKHGSLLHPTLGASFRLAAITTDLPLEHDRPTTARVADLCTNCSLCVDNCPGDAISHEKSIVRGADRWIVDTEKCAPIWASYHACAICLQVCPWNARAGDGPIRELYIRTVKSAERVARNRRLREQAAPPVRPPDPTVVGAS